MRRAHFVVLAIAVVLSFALAGAAQAQSNIQVTAIKLTPSSFKIGSVVTIAVDAKNGGTAATGPATAYVDVFKSDTWLASERVFHAEQPVAGMPAGGTSSATFASKWTVADPGTGKFYVRVTVIDPPNEFGNPKSVVYISSCTFNRAMSLVTLPKLSVKDLRPHA